jgi:hypothetical protein
MTVYYGLPINLGPSACGTVFVVVFQPLRTRARCRSGLVNC